MLQDQALGAHIMLQGQSLWARCQIADRPPCIPPFELSILFPPDPRVCSVAPTARISSADELLCEIFAATVRARPQATALITAGGRLTYAELDQRAEALARGLIRQGIGPGQVVGLWLPRGCELLIGQIAIAKTGAAWLPFDADAPIDRIATCLEDARGLGSLKRRPAGRDGARETRLSGADCGRSRRSLGSHAVDARALGATPDRSRLSDLHLGLDRHAERHCDLEPQHLPFSARRE